MERSLEDFIEQQNIARFADQLKTECDPLKRRILLDLIAREESKRADHIQIKEK